MEERFIAHQLKKKPKADKWTSVKQALRRLEKYVWLEKQVVVRQVKAHVTGYSRTHIKDRMNFDTEGNEKADEVANMGAVVGKALASEMQYEREKRKAKHQVRSSSS